MFISNDYDFCIICGRELKDHEFEMCDHCEKKRNTYAKDI